MTHSTPAKARLAVLISGNGSNLQAILDACADGRLNALVTLVVSNHFDAYGINRANRAGVPVLCLPRRNDQARAEYDAELASFVAASQPDWVVLAGWMRILSTAFLRAFPGRVINLHPALPGTFPGAHAIEDAFNAYRQGQIVQTGVMVHLVPDEGVDCGPVLASETVAIQSQDTLENLEARIHQVEHRLLVETLAKLVNSSELLKESPK